MVDISLKKFDSHGMYDHIMDFHKQLLDGIEIGNRTKLGAIDYGGVDNIILAGMGGSAIGGELLRSFLKAELNLPFIIHRNYGLPAVADSESLVICSSYSGNTEETISAFKTAVELNSIILCITTGGELKALAESHQVPVVKIPAGLMPREALGYSFTPLLVLFSRMGFCRDYTVEINGCAEDLRKWSDEFSFENDLNPAYELAGKLAGKIAVIYSGPDYFDAVALRLKGQVSENGKQHAFCNVFPEFNHNELVGWELAAKNAGGLIVLIIRDEQDHPQVSKRMDIVRKLIAQKGVEVIELRSRGKNLLTRMFSLIQFGDYLSYYLALVNNVDPTPIDMIEYMKQHLRDK
jgi:glucose/mannose-6-phosphate isomerase